MWCNDGRAKELRWQDRRVNGASRAQQETVWEDDKREYDGNEAAGRDA